MSTEDLTLEPIPPPPSTCQPSILLNPIPCPSSSAKTSPQIHNAGVVVKRPCKVTEQFIGELRPPQHWIDESPDYTGPGPKDSSYYITETTSNHHLNVEAPEMDQEDEGPKKCTFAPLPPGRRHYRSNSISVGVAARARMINSQGTGNLTNNPRHAGPHWAQTGGQDPHDVYTIHDLAKGARKIFIGLKNRTSSIRSKPEVISFSHVRKDGASVEHIEDVKEDFSDEMQLYEITDFQNQKSARGLPQQS